MKVQRQTDLEVININTPRYEEREVEAWSRRGGDRHLTYIAKAIADECTPILSNTIDVVVVQKDLRPIQMELNQQSSRLEDTEQYVIILEDELEGLHAINKTLLNT